MVRSVQEATILNYLPFILGYVISAAPLKELARDQLDLRGAEEGI
jgi:hypothetical protein